MRTGFRIDAEKCTECQRCLAACSFVKLGEVRPSLSRITVQRRWPQVPEIRVCRFDECPTAPCIASCPVEAIAVQRGPGAIRLVLIDPEACTGCGACLEACPFQAIRLDTSAGGGAEQQAFKCDYCGGAPACVPECVTGALTTLEGAGSARSAHRESGGGCGMSALKPAASSMTGRLLRIDLGKRSARLWQVPPGLQSYIGGMGYGVKILVDEVPPRTDPLGPENKLVLTVGPLTGTLAPMHPQACIVTKSPLTGTILNSYAGGFLGAEIKFAGLDGLVLEGQAREWVALLIDDGKVSFHDAAELAGKSTAQTEGWMKGRFGPEVRTLSIGRAGEKQVAMASAFSETRAFGRGGPGAVLGAMRVKGIAVRGTGGVAAARPEEFTRLVAENMELIRRACAEEFNLVGMFSRVGTGAGMGLVDGRGGLATRNHEYGSFEAAAQIDGFAYAKNFYTRAIACFGCPVHCGMLHRFRRADGSDSWLRGPEYETMFSLGSDLLNGDPVALAEANQLCEEYGMDTLTAGVTVAWALEMAEDGALSEPGLPLRFGDRDAVLGLLRKIGEREGIGDLLAEGPKRAAERLGGDAAGRVMACAMQVKNSGFAAWMPRRMKGTGLAFATSNRGACHKRAPIGAEITGQIDMDAYEGKAALVREIQDRVNAIFTLVSCRFHEFVTPAEAYPRFLAAATGQELSLEQFLAVGERIWNLERLFNLGAGLSRADDALPGRCFEPIKGEKSEGARIERDRFEAMLDEYYGLRGWDRQGVPTGKTLARLGIEGYAGLAGP